MLSEESRKSLTIDLFRQWDNVLFKSKWLGINAVKNPCDAWVYQEILFETKPDLVVETGSFQGGGTIFIASIMDLIGHGEIISVDIENRTKPVHNRITWLSGGSTQPALINDIFIKAKNKSVMVILDSDHNAEHVLKELKAYGKLVSSGKYLIVEDTWWKPGSGGPADAVNDYLKDHSEFKIDKSREPYIITNNPDGFLRRI